MGIYEEIMKSFSDELKNSLIEIIQEENYIAGEFITGNTSKEK